MAPTYSAGKILDGDYPIVLFLEIYFHPPSFNCGGYLNIKIKSVDNLRKVYDKNVLKRRDFVEAEIKQLIVEIVIL